MQMETLLGLRLQEWSLVYSRCSSNRHGMKRRHQNAAPSLSRPCTPHPSPATEWAPAQSSGAGNQVAPLPPLAGPSEPQSLSGSQPHKNLRPPLALGRHREREADAGPKADPSLALERIQTPKPASTEPGSQVPFQLHGTARGRPRRVRTTTIAPTREDAECRGCGHGPGPGRGATRERHSRNSNAAPRDAHVSSKGCPCELQQMPA